MRAIDGRYGPVDQSDHRRAVYWALPSAPYFQQILRPLTVNVFSSMKIVLSFSVLICRRVLADVESQKSWRQSQSEISSVNFNHEQQGLSRLSFAPHQC